MDGMLHVYDARSGTRRRTIGRSLLHATGVSVDRRHVYVTGERCVHVLARGTHANRRPSPCPSAVSCSRRSWAAIACALFAVDDGRVLRAFGSRGTACGAFKQPYHVHVAFGHVFVADSSNNRVHMFRRDGTFVCFVGNGDCEPGFGDGLLLHPCGVAATVDSDVFVVDTSDACRCFV